ncbi:MAG: dephospho-CoA kinase, partial [Clostridia bacterium]|nr:dephospho-CoA kinase [Clostridia bacterium]
MWVLGAVIAAVLIRSPAIRALGARKQAATKLLGITGPTGAGKTTALQTLKELGVTIVDADEVYHELLEENVKLREALTKRFGDLLLDETGRVDRKKLGERVFGDPEALEELNRITHKFVGEEIDSRVASARIHG